MKKLIIAFLNVIPLLGFGQSPAPSASKSMANYEAPAAAADMEYTFTAKSVAKPQMSTFQERGIQKLKDFYNYLTIISNPSYDKRLRDNAKVQAKQLFLGGDCKVGGKSAYNFIDSCADLNKEVDWKALNINVLQDMSTNTNAADTGTYHGELTYKESINSTISGAKTAEIVLSKSEKQFGNTKRGVWTIFICSIE